MSIWIPALIRKIKSMHVPNFPCNWCSYTCVRPCHCPYEPVSPRYGGSAGGSGAGPLVYLQGVTPASHRVALTLKTHYDMKGKS